MKLRYQTLFYFFIVLLTLSIANACRRTNVFTIALDSPFTSLDVLNATKVDANAERVRTLMYNTLVKKNEKFEYVGDLAREINTSFDATQLTFVLHDNVRFHNGKQLTAADAKATFESMFKAGGAKATTFFEKINNQTAPMILEITAPNEKTLIFKLARPALKNNILANLVAIPIMPENDDSGAPNNSVADPTNFVPPAGTGPYKFVRFDTANNVVELVSNEDYWEGAPNIKQIRVRPISDSTALQAELRSGRVSIAPMTTNLSPDTIKNLGDDADLKVQQFSGANIQYLSFNTSIEPLNNQKVRQAIAFAINREQLIDELLFGQAAIAHSILPADSWAYAESTKYSYDPDRAKQLLDEAGFKTNANGMRLAQPIKFKIAASNAATGQYAQVIQNQLKEVGIPVEIETAEFTTLIEQLQKGQYQMTTARYVGGNQDPIYLRDLFASSEIGRANRTRFNNPEYDKIIGQAVNEIDRTRAKQLYAEAQAIISREVPLLPLWYPANVVVASKNVGNIEVQGSGDWYFVKNLTFNK